MNIIIYKNIKPKKHNWILDYVDFFTLFLIYFILDSDQIEKATYIGSTMMCFISLKTIVNCCSRVIFVQSFYECV